MPRRATRSGSNSAVSAECVCLCVYIDSRSDRTDLPSRQRVDGVSGSGDQFSELGAGADSIVAWNPTSIRIAGRTSAALSYVYRQHQRRRGAHRSGAPR